MDVYLEIGKKRVFAAAAAWPGWCRSGRDEKAALDALLAHGSRYAAVVAHAGVRQAFVLPKGVASLRITERLAGDATTEFGAPSASPAGDPLPVTAAELRRSCAIMTASWVALEDAARDAEGVPLMRGPRGGGRELAAILNHVADAEAAYAARIAVRLDGSAPAAVRRDALLEGLTRAVTEGISATGPRGGARWSPRYFVRRAVWHVLDHTWEIQDRSKVHG